MATETRREYEPIQTGEGIGKRRGGKGKGSAPGRRQNAPMATETRRDTHASCPGEQNREGGKGPLKHVADHEKQNNNYQA